MGSLTAQSAATTPSVVALPIIAERYRAQSLLGHGGMAHVYAVDDAATGRSVALKQLSLPEKPERRREIYALFEREFHTLTQLRHPRVVEVFDYGVDAELGPYYTMELLDGGDLREQSPIDWHKACALLFDVCSALALLHSRRLLHRDVSPRNVRCTRAGHAKLIDFGALSPIGRSAGRIVGTPAFTPPEVLQHSLIDERSDLFSVGATLYYALTRGLAYPARSFGALSTVWLKKPASPSAIVPGIPAALDDLVLSLLSLEPAQRPQSAFEVMQRLAAIGGFECTEPSGVSRGYVSTPLLAGRDAVMSEVRELLAEARQSCGLGMLFVSEPGLGRSRILDACALEAKLQGAIVLRAAGDQSATQDFAVARALVQHARDTLSNESHAPNDTSMADPARSHSTPPPPPLPLFEDGAEAASDPDTVQRTLSRYMLALSDQKLLMLVVDDVQKIDAQSAAFLAALADRAPSHKLLIALGAEQSASAEASFDPALDLLARRCRTLRLQPLTHDETETLLHSMFGDVAHLQIVAQEIDAIAHGSPREIVVVAQHLIDNHTFRYAGGRWTLPDHLTAAQLPSDAAAAIRARIDALTPLARQLAESHALAFHDAMTREQYLVLCAGTASSEVDAAISELLSKKALVSGSDGRNYTLANRLWSATLDAGLDAQSKRDRHASLAAMYGERVSEAAVHHFFAAGLDQRGLDALLVRVAGFAQQFDVRVALGGDVSKLAASYVRAIEVAHELGRPAREQQELRRWLVSLSVVTDARYYHLVAADWLKQLEHDSGLDLWRADSATLDAGARITRALQGANERHLATPEAQRVYRVDEAIKQLATYVAISVAIAARTMNSTLYLALPDLLEPFVPLSPIVRAVWQNVTASRAASQGRYMQARAHWLEAYAQLESLQGSDLQHVDVIRNAVAISIAMCEALLGRVQLEAWASRLEHDPMHRVNAQYLRKLARVNQGDWRAAERCRRRAEVYALQSGATQLFTTLLAVELSTHAQARDMAGVQEVAARIEPIAARYPDWVPFRHLAQARFQLLRGDLEAAELGFERCVEMTEPNGAGRSRALAAWIAACTGLTETLLEQNRDADALRLASRVLTRCDEIGVELQTFELVGMCAVAAAKLGDATVAQDRMARLDAVIAGQLELGVSGLKLGLSHEHRARAALWSGDAAGLAHHTTCCAEQYRHAEGSPLGARCDRLLNEIRRAGAELASAVTDIEAVTSIERSAPRSDSGSDEAWGDSPARGADKAPD